MSRRILIKVFILHFVMDSILKLSWPSQFAVCLSICPVSSARRQRRDLCGFRVKLSPVTNSLATQRRGNPVKCLAQGHNKRTCQPTSRYFFLFLIVKQGICEYQLLKYFGLTRPGNRIQVY